MKMQETVKEKTDTYPTRNKILFRKINLIKKLCNEPNDSLNYL